jgi:selenophosphate synthetase-related protein
MPLLATNISIMPSESSFKKQVDFAREALKNFSAVKDLNVPGLIRTTLAELINTVVSYRFYPLR